MILSTTVTLRGTGFPVDYPEAAKRAALLKRQIHGRGEQLPCPMCKGDAAGKVNCIRCRGVGTVTMATMARINFSDNDDEGRVGAIALMTWGNALGLRPSTVMRLSEFGGQLNDSIGNAVIIAGPKGEKLPRRGEARNSEHATFWTDRALICDISRTGEKVNGVIKMIEITSDLQPKVTTLYRIKGGLDSIVKEGTHNIEIPKDMIEAAIAKTHTAKEISAYSIG